MAGNRVSLRFVKSSRAYDGRVSPSPYTLNGVREGAPFRFQLHRHCPQNPEKANSQNKYKKSIAKVKLLYYSVFHEYEIKNPTTGKFKKRRRHVARPGKR
jgi:hypothetical protein